MVLISGGTVSYVAGLLEVEGGILNQLLSRIRSRFSIDALTLGHVILGQDREAVIMSDLVQQEGLKMAIPGKRTTEQLRSVSPPWATPSNPFDLGVALQFNDSFRVYETLVTAMCQDEAVDALHIQLPRQMIVQAPREFLGFFNRLPLSGKPLAVWVAGMESGTHETLQWLEEQQIPVFTSPEKAIHALSVLHRLS
ncbi:MAG: hypothetical protein AB1585_17645 [Thermodesulfobacteriota bacterium]